MIDEVINKIQAITDETAIDLHDSIYHVEMALFPLTKSKGGKE